MRCRSGHSASLCKVLRMKNVLLVANAKLTERATGCAG